MTPERLSHRPGIARVAFYESGRREKGDRAWHGTGRAAASSNDCEFRPGVRFRGSPGAGSSSPAGRRPHRAGPRRRARALRDPDATAQPTPLPDRTRDRSGRGRGRRRPPAGLPQRVHQPRPVRSTFAALHLADAYRHQRSVSAPTIVAAAWRGWQRISGAHNPRPVPIRAPSIRPMRASFTAWWRPPSTACRNRIVSSSCSGTSRG